MNYSKETWQEKDLTYDKMKKGIDRSSSGTSGLSNPRDRSILLRFNRDVYYTPTLVLKTTLNRSFDLMHYTLYTRWFYLTAIIEIFLYMINKHKMEEWRSLYQIYSFLNSRDIKEMYFPYWKFDDRMGVEAITWKRVHKSIFLHFSKFTMFLF